MTEKNNSSYFLGLDLLGHHLKHWMELGEWGYLSGDAHVLILSWHHIRIWLPNINSVINCELKC